MHSPCHRYSPLPQSSAGVRPLDSRVGVVASEVASEGVNILVGVTGKG